MVWRFLQESSCKKIVGKIASNSFSWKVILLFSFLFYWKYSKVQQAMLLSYFSFIMQVICSGKGNCVCNKCDCDEGYIGDRCQECVSVSLILCLCLVKPVSRLWWPNCKGNRKIDLLIIILFSSELPWPVSRLSRVCSLSRVWNQWFVSGRM